MLSASQLLEMCKILMTVCETIIVEDPNELTVTTENNYKIHGEALLKLLPEPARLQMMKITEAYQQELEADPPFDLYNDDDDGAALVGTSGSAGVDDDDDDNDDDDFMLAEHFYHFKQYFTEKEAATFVKKVDKAIEGAMKSLLEDGADDDDDDEEEDDDDLEDEDDWKTDASVLWKGEKRK
jgi:hypothetical protein